jgi:arsenate reductase
LHPQVVEAMQERGISIDSRLPKAITQEDVEWAEVVVTMGCGDACPVLPGKRYVDWSLADPAVMPLEEVRGLRDEIERLVAELRP